MKNTKPLRWHFYLLAAICLCACGAGDRLWSIDVENQLRMPVVIEVDYFGTAGQGKFYTVPARAKVRLPGDHVLTGLAFIYPLFDTNLKPIGAIKYNDDAAHAALAAGTQSVVITQKCLGEFPKPGRSWE